MDGYLELNCEAIHLYEELPRAYGDESPMPVRGALEALNAPQGGRIQGMAAD